MKRKKQQSKFLMQLVGVLSLAIILVGGFYIVKGMTAQKGESGTSTISHNNYYTLRSNATDYQKQIYEELSAELNKEKATWNDQTISELVAKNYIADFYTWTNKLRFNDVGGMQFINEGARKWVFDKALDNIYSDMNYYLEKGTLANTLEVVDTQTNVNKIRFILVEEEKNTDGKIVTEEVIIDAYRVTINWTYKSTTGVELSKYQNESQITVVKDDDGLYSIVEVTNGQKESNNA